MVNTIKTLGGSVEAYGAYFTPSMKYIDTLKEQLKLEGKHKQLYSVNLSIKNPYVTTDQIEVMVINKKRFDELKAKGHDGVILKRNGKNDEVVVFNQSQIRVSKELKNR